MSGEELKTTLKGMGVELVELATKLKMSKQSLNSKLQAKDVSISFLQDVSKAVNKNLYSLLGGEDDSTQADDRKSGSKEYLHKRRNLKNGGDDEEVPVFYGNTRAGIVQVYADDPDMQKPVGTLSAKLFPGCNHAEKVSGDSMYPLIINQGVIVGKIMEKSGFIWGEKYGIHTRYGMNVAKFVHPSSKNQHVKLVSYNTSIPDQEIMLDDITFCFRILFIINPA